MSNAIVCAQDQLPDHAGYPFPKEPNVPGMWEGINVWFFEENGDFGVPRLAVDRVTGTWNERLVCANFALRDGRVYDGWGTFPAVSDLDDKNKPMVLGASVLKFRCIEPFKKWHVSYSDEPIAGDSSSQIAKTMDPTKKARIRLDAEMTLRPPPWAQVFGENDKRPEAAFMGLGWRYEVPIDVEGAFEVDGKSRTFKGLGSLINRQSIRTIPDEAPGFYGHAWLAAHFPDGRAFGCNVYPTVDRKGKIVDGEGDFPYNTGYIYKDGKIYKAKVVKAPWLRELKFEGDDCSVVLDSELGTTHIKGKTLLSTFKPTWNRMGGLSLQQSGVRYTWDDQTAIGMTERSS